MTDEELIARLRELGDHASFEPHMHHTAADRIEQLVATNEALIEKSARRLVLARDEGVARVEQFERAEAAEAKLAKAVEALELIVVDNTWGLEHQTYMKCRTTLAEIKGESHE